MTNRNDRNRRQQVWRGERQNHAFQGAEGTESTYGHGSGDYGYRTYGPGNMGSGGMDRDQTNPSANSYRGPHYGKGPRNYQPSDERLREDVIHALTDHPEIDATDIDVKVELAEAFLYGHVPDRRQKRLAADVAFGVRGIQDVYNSIRAGHNEAGGQPENIPDTGSTGVQD